LSFLYLEDGFSNSFKIFIDLFLGYFKGKIMWNDILSGFSLVFQWSNLVAALGGVAFGMIMGAVPGLTSNMAISLLIPFTFYMNNPIAAIAMLMGLSKGGNFGGSIPAILFNIPGTPQAMVTTFDGYPLNKQGKSGKALKIALYSSVMADTMSDFVLFFLAGPVSLVALKIGPPEYSMIILFSLVVISMVATDEPVRGLIAIGLGLLIGIVGLDPLLGTPRLTFGSLHLSAGFQIVPLVIGLLALSEVLRLIEVELHPGVNVQGKRSEKIKGDDNPDNHRVLPHEFRRCLPAIFRGVGIGSIIGIIPGIGTTVASYLSYVSTKRSSKHPERFGKGAIEGVAAAESGNNAVVGPNLVPLVTLGIPGNEAAALILGAFMIKGLTPGPLFMQNNAPMLYALFTVLVISNIFTFLVGNLFVRYVRFVTRLPNEIMYPMILVFCFIGSYVFNSSLFDVLTMFLFGIFGYFLTKLRIPLPPVIVAFFLGPLLERKFRQAFIIAGNKVDIFFTHPISLGFLILTTIVVIVFVLLGRRKSKTSQ